jgi:hypothetical protein
MQFINLTSPLPWIVAGVAAGVVALYFLKLKRQPVQVPSTFLWQKSVEDLHVNSLFQRLRKNLLLFLQLFILALALLALLRPAWSGPQAGGMRHVILIDNSASMSATDVEPNRLEWAKRSAREEIIDKMAGDDMAMIIAFNDAASVVQSYTSNRQRLRERLDSIGPTQRTTNLREALDVASGLANPQSFSAGAADTKATVETAAPKLHIYTDGGFADIKDFALAALEPHYYAVGQAGTNIAIVGMMVRRNEESPDTLQVFARLYNFAAAASPKDAPPPPLTATCELHIDGELKDAIEVAIESRSEKAVTFDLYNFEQGVLELRLVSNDSLAADNVARAVVGSVRRAKVLVVTVGNRSLERALTTETARAVAEVEFVTPGDIEQGEYRQKSLNGHFDLIVYDRCVPSDMPQSNTLFFGAVPNTKALGEPKTVASPIIAEVNDTHPLFRFLNMDDVGIAESLLVEIPPGTDRLLESSDGPLAFLLSREGFWDCVIGFWLERPTEKGREFNTNWVLHPSFPLFTFNALRVLGNVQDSITDDAILPGQTVVLRSDSLARELVVKDPSGKSHELSRTPQGTFIFNDTEQLGLYEFGSAEKPERPFAVNLFDMRESDITPRPELEIGHAVVAASAGVSRARKEAWRWLALAAFAVLLAEWYIYNRRVYI